MSINPSKRILRVLNLYAGIGGNRQKWGGQYSRDCR